MIRKFFCAAFAAAALLTAGCGQSTHTTDKPAVTPADPLWTQAISAHSAGAISRRSPIRISFINDVVPPEKQGTDASALVTIEPALNAHITFASQRDILITPISGELAPGATYKVRLSPKGLNGVAEKLAPYEFLVKTLEPNFDVSTLGLDVDPSNDESMVLRGSIVTSDAEKNESVTKLLRAELSGKTLPITWVHADDGREHSFMVAGITRTEVAQALKLSWDGTPLNVKQSDSRDIEVPGRGMFTVTQAQALDDSGQRQVIVQFSDNLDSRQDLKGLVRLSQGEFTTQIRGNALTLYVNQDVVGDITLSLDKALRNRAGDKLGAD